MSSSTSPTSRRGVQIRHNVTPLLQILPLLALLSSSSVHADSITKIRGLPINMNPLNVVVKHTLSSHDVLRAASPSTDNHPPRARSIDQTAIHATEQAAALALLTPAERRAHDMFIKALPSMSPAYVASISEIFTKENPAVSRAPLILTPKLLLVSVVHKEDEPAGTWAEGARREHVTQPVVDMRTLRPLQLQALPIKPAAKQGDQAEQLATPSFSWVWIWSALGSWAMQTCQLLVFSGALYWSATNGLLQWLECEVLNMVGMCSATVQGAVYFAGQVQSHAISLGKMFEQRAPEMPAAAAVSPANTPLAIAEDVPKEVTQPAAQPAQVQVPPQTQQQPVTDVMMHTHSAEVEQKVSRLENAAIDMMRAGKAVEAASILREGIDYLCRLGKEMHVDVAALRHLLVKCHLAQGEAKVAESLLRKILTVYAYACGGCTSSDSYTAQALDDMSQALAAQGRRIEARLAAAKAAEIRQVLSEVLLEAAAFAPISLEEKENKELQVLHAKDSSSFSSKTPERTSSCPANQAGSAPSPAPASAPTQSSRGKAHMPAAAEADPALDILDLDALEKKLKGAVFDIAPAGSVGSFGGKQSAASASASANAVYAAPNTQFKISPCRTASPLRGGTSSRVLQNASTPTRSRRVA